MIGLRRRGKLPADRRPPLEQEERVVAWAPTPDGQTVVATNRGLWLPGGGSRLGWHEIHKATWAQGRLTVTPAEQVGQGEQYAVMADLPSIGVALPEPGGVPHHVRARVTRSVAYTRHHPLPGGAVRVVGRRVPGVDGVSWHVRYESGADRADPEIRRITAELVDQARTEVSTGDL